MFCTPKEAEALKVQAVLAKKPLNQHILDTMGAAEVDTTAAERTPEADATPQAQGR